jgi:hypothetical protein
MSILMVGTPQVTEIIIKYKHEYTYGWYSISDGNNNKMQAKYKDKVNMVDCKKHPKSKLHSI